MERKYEGIVINGNLQSTDNGVTFRKKVIGANYVNGVRFGGYLSSFDGSFSNEEIGVGNGIEEIYNCVIGDIKDAYTILKDKLNSKQSSTFEDLCISVYETCDEYFGGIENIDSRLSYYRPVDEIMEGESLPKISDLEGKGAAMCVERAALSQNLLKNLNINALYKSSGIINSGAKECHSYNLIEHDGRYYIFDASIPTIIDDKISPLVAEIDEQTFNMISCPLASTGCSVHVNHYNPIRNKQVDIIYDSARQNYFDADKMVEAKSANKI